MGLFYGEVIGTIIGNVDGITLGIDFGTDLGYLYRSFDGSNYDKLGGLLFGDSLGSTDGRLLGSGEGVWFSFSFVHSLTPIVVFCWYGIFWYILLCSKIIAGKKNYFNRHLFY